MRIVIQRVRSASVEAEGRTVGSIGEGMLLLLGIEDGDGEEDIEWLCKKTAQMRIFSDSEGLMNRSIQDIGGAFLVVSQFTLHASTKKGNRPSFIRAARPAVAVPLYERFKEMLHTVSGLPVASGEFGADMKVSLINDGPVTILMDSKNRE